MSQRRSVLSSARLIALCTLLSRVSGLLRDVLLNAAFGKGRIADAFTFVFRIPNLFGRLFGEGALTAVFVPTFTKALDGNGRPAAWRLLSRTATLLTVVLSALILFFEIVLLIIWLLGGNRDSLVLALTAIMLPFM